MKTKKQLGGRTRLAKKKAKFAKNAQVDMFPSFNQIYKYRSVLPIDKIKFLQKYKKNHSNTLSQEDIDGIDEYSEQKLINFHKNTLILFMATGRNSVESDFQFDEENVLDMNTPMCDDYLNELLENHNTALETQYMDENDDDKDYIHREQSYLEKSYNEYEILRQIPRLFLLYWTGMNKGKSILETKIAPELVDHTMSFVARNDKYDKLFSSAKAKTRKIKKSQSK